jgi:hypothetical protein
MIRNELGCRTAIFNREPVLLVKLLQRLDVGSIAIQVGFSQMKEGYKHASNSTTPEVR